MTMKTLLRPLLVLFGALTVLTGLLYPLLVTGIAQGLMPDKANGSLVRRDGVVVGSSLIAQPFADAGYFWSRPSAISTPDGPNAYDATSSAGSNLGPTNPALSTAVRERIATLRAADPGNDAPVPIDLVTASGSGLDPELSPAAAYYQVRRVALARHAEEAEVRALVDAAIVGRVLGVLGEPTVNVLRLNLALDERLPRPPRAD